MPDDDKIIRPVAKAATALEVSRRRMRWPITLILGLGFGVLMLVAVASVLILGVLAARENTADLLRDKASLTLSSVVGRIEAHLKPVEAQVSYLAVAIARNEIDIADADAVRQFFSGALAATPQVSTLILVRPDLSLWRVGRDQPVIHLESWADEPRTVAALEEAREQTASRWARPVWAPLLRQSVLTYRTPVHGADGFMGLLIAGITVDDLSRYVRTLSDDLNETVFILYDFETVLAHPGLVGNGTAASGAKPMPGIDEVGDPVLARIWDEDRRALDAMAPLSRGTGHIAEVAGAEQIYIYRDLRLPGERPWIVGLHLPASQVDEEILRLRNMIIGGVVLLVVFLLLTLAIGRWLSAPITRLALAAERIRQLDLATIDQLGPSRVREYDEAARAFNSMVVGLKWFETYLPRKLVSRLISSGEFTEPPSEERTVTVLFTDIVGFSSFAEGKSARDVAAFLNHHFTLVGECIEDEEGTIDKYIGDSVMAFWGAPTAQPDQALRACRAALRMAETVHADNATRTAEGGQPVRMRIGIHTGRAIVGNIGSSDRLNYTLVGDGVNIAQRLEQLGKEVGPERETVVLISETTADGLPPDMRLKDEGSWELRGRDAPLRVLQLVG